MSYRSLHLVAAMIALVALLGLSPTASARSKKLTVGESINLNTAGFRELVRLKGVGKATAKRILEYREANGPFDSVDDLTDVRGIGKKKMAAIRPFLRLEGEAFIGTAPTKGAGVKGMDEEEQPSNESPPSLPRDESTGKDDVEVL
jgi:comEA protein